jgi:hypothetical protein
LERSLLVRGTDKVRIAELFNHPRTSIVPTFTRGLVNVNTPQEFMAQVEIAEAKNQPSMWIKRRPAFKSDGQPNPEMSKSAATNARPVRNNEVHQQC